jgi:hypothetical protein
VPHAIALRYPFLTAEQAAFFLQVPVTTARAKFDEGELPQATRLDGGPFQPSYSSRLIPYDQFHAIVGEEAQRLLDLWQRGRFDVPKAISVEAPQVELKDILLSLSASEVVNDQAGEV